MIERRDSQRRDNLRLAVKVFFLLLLLLMFYAFTDYTFNSGRPKVAQRFLERFQLQRLLLHYREVELPPSVLAARKTITAELEVQLRRLPRRLLPSDLWIVERMNRRGIRTDFWTINDPDEALHLASLGADGIMTDDPRTIATALGRLPRL